MADSHIAGICMRDGLRDTGCNDQHGPRVAPVSPCWTDAENALTPRWNLHALRRAHKGLRRK